MGTRDRARAVADVDVDVGVIRVEATPQELAAADLVIVLTDHDAFDYDAVARHGRCVLDTRCRVRAEGVEYLRLGAVTRGAS